jgi:hypothetical protein
MAVYTQIYTVGMYMHKDPNSVYMCMHCYPTALNVPSVYMCMHCYHTALNVPDCIQCSPKTIYAIDKSICIYWKGLNDADQNSEFRHILIETHLTEV